ncbi:MAG TPA: succinate dehydrogenase, cytochrome b556 subunit [Thermoprotei archaeon]|nr:succinate dehydrogenase, cytochrome b556 subunit [Thermoprotei archaeon]
MGRKSGKKGLIGWITPFTNIERLLYTLHRITGIGLTLYLFIHIYETSLRMYGAETWIETVEFLENPIFHFGLLLVVLAAIFHGVNGIRLILQELGLIAPRPTQPVYPYRKYHRDQKIWRTTIIMIILGIGVAIFALRDFMILLGLI